MAALAGAAFLSFAHLIRGLEELRADGARAQAVSAKVEQIGRRTENVSRQVTRIRKQVKHLPYVNVELARRHKQLIHDDLPMPVLGANWAVTAPTVLFIVDEVLGNDRLHILECGSGASTVWTAAALRARGDGHVHSLEHNRRFAEQTRKYLRVHGLEKWATVIDAPLVDRDVSGLGVVPWYDLTGLPDDERFDVLFVDGPPGSTARLARYPAMPALIAQLEPGAVVVVDDTHRKPEQAIVKKWAEPGAFERRVSVAKQVGQSTVLHVT